MIEFFSKRAGKSSLVFFASYLAAISVVMMFSSMDLSVALALICTFGPALLASMYSAICDLSAEVLKLRATLDEVNASVSKSGTRTAG